MSELIMVQVGRLTWVDIGDENWYGFHTADEKAFMDVVLNNPDHACELAPRMASTFKPKATFSPKDAPKTPVGEPVPPKKTPAKPKSKAKPKKKK